MADNNNLIWQYASSPRTSQRMDPSRRIQSLHGVWHLLHHFSDLVQKRVARSHSTGLALDNFDDVLFSMDYEVYIFYDFDIWDFADDCNGPGYTIL